MTYRSPKILSLVSLVMGFASCQTLFAQVSGGCNEPVSIAICIVTVIAIRGAVAGLGSARNPKAAMVTSMDPALATIDPAAIVREAKNLPVDPVYPAFRQVACHRNATAAKNCGLAALTSSRSTKKDSFPHKISPAKSTSPITRGIVMRRQWSLAIHHEDRDNDSFISEDQFNNFKDLHETMKKNKGRIFVVRIPATAKPMEIQAIHNLRNLGYRLETQ